MLLKLSVQQRGLSELEKKKRKGFINFKSFMDSDLVETNQVAGSLAESRANAKQLTPAYPEKCSLEIPEGSWETTDESVGKPAILPLIIVVRFNCSANITIRENENLQHRRCPALHLLALIMGGVFPEVGRKGGLTWVMPT
jgi:hypothetical protein